jgi:UDPglucose 6-dehydrogenase
MDETRRIYGDRADLELCADPYTACKGADALVICTEWQVFRSPEFDRLKELLRRPLIIDGRNLYDPAMLRQKGFAYHGIGRA